MKSIHHIVLILLTILAVLSVSLCASAQDIDIDSMSNEQLMGLLQSIMQKLQQDDSPEPAETPAVPETSEEPAEPEEPDTEAVTETKPEEAEKAEAETEEFQIYENKKLLKSRLPDSYFVKPETKEKKEEPPTKKNPPTNPPLRPGDRPRPNVPGDGIPEG